MLVLAKLKYSPTLKLVAKVVPVPETSVPLMPPLITPLLLINPRNEAVKFGVTVSTLLLAMVVTV